MIWYAVLKAWALVSPVLGPIVLAARTFLPALNFGRYIVPVAAVALGVFVVWRGASLFMAGPQPATIAVSEIEANQLRARLQAERAAHDSARAVLRQRTLELDQERTALETLKANQELDRAQSIERDPTLATVGVLPADDPWVRRKLNRRKPATSPGR